MMTSPASPMRTLGVSGALVAAVAAVAVFQACDRGGGSADGGIGADGAKLTSEAGSFTRAQVLEAAGACVVETVRAFAKKSEALAGATRTLEADASDANLKAAAAAYADAMLSWQRAEVMQFGPLGRSPSPGAKDLRDPIYSWPLSSRCLMEQAIVSRGYADPSFATASLVNTRGLGAEEYLLYFTGTENGCPANAQINTSGAWAALGAAELRTRRAAYARVVAGDVATRAGALVAAWEPSGGNFAGELARAGLGSAVFASDQSAFNAIVEGLFYLDDELKDLKIGKPLGLNDCPQASCADAVEAPYSKLGRAHVKQNLIGFRSLFFGCGEGGAGLGFDDLLVGTGAGSVADAALAAY